jgi:Flp pilus assembly protein TadG
MRKLIGRRLDPQHEDGVTLVIVALCLIALFGMLVLVVDVGGLLLNRREMVNASDAAALSAAKTCSIKASSDVYGSDPELAADTLAHDNSSTAQTSGQNIIQISQTPCTTQDHGYVTVRYTSNQQLFFAGVLTGGTTKPVTTQATAIWGPAGLATPVPLAIYTQSLGSNCNIKTLPTGSDCYFWFDNNNFGTSRFGILDLRPWNGTNASGWDVPKDTQSCGQGVGADTLSDWMTGAGVSELDVNYQEPTQDPTYVCIIEGTPESKVWGSLEKREGDTLTFPINRCEVAPPFVEPGGQVTNDGTEVPCTTAPHKYDIIGFVDFQLVQVMQSQAEWGGTPLTNCQDNNFSVTHGQTYSLLKPPVNGGQCPSTPPSGVINLTIDGKAPSAGDYTVDDSAKPMAFTWTGADGKVKVSYDWWQNGACGQPPPSSSAVCLLVKTVEVRVGGKQPGHGSGLGNVRAVKLCDPAIPTSCDPYTVPQVP